MLMCDWTSHHYHLTVQALLLPMGMEARTFLQVLFSLNGDTECLISATSLLTSLVFAHFALGRFPFISDANLLPLVASGSLWASPSGKCWEQTCDCGLSWLSSIPNTVSHLTSHLDCWETDGRRRLDLRSSRCHTCYRYIQAFSI